MVRINLIPSGRARRKKPLEIQNQLVIGAIALAGVILVLGVTWILLDTKLASLDLEKKEKSQELELVKAKVQEVENYERDKKTVLDRIGVIHQLRANQAIPVQLLDGISQGIPIRVWLTALSENTGRVDLQGRAMTNGEIVDFVNHLKENPMFKDVQLVESRQEKEQGVLVYSFKLNFSVVPGAV